MEKTKIILIERADNGFAAYPCTLTTEISSIRREFMVAETPERITEIVADWAGQGSPKMAQPVRDFDDAPARARGAPIDQHDLGRTAIDVITGFEGVVTAYAIYLTGCNQVCLVPKAVDKAGAVNALWVDVQRLTLTDALPITLDNGVTPGCDMPAPPAR